MRTPDQTIDHSTLRRLVHAGAHVGADVIGAGGSWGVVVHYGRVSQTLAATRGEPRMFKKFETLASYLKELGIVEYRVNAAEFEPGAAAANPHDRRSVTSSERMRRTHEAAAYDKWFRQQVQAAIDDPRASVPDAEVRREFAAKREALRAQATTTPETTPQDPPKASRKPARKAEH